MLSSDCSQLHCCQSLLLCLCVSLLCSRSSITTCRNTSSCSIHEVTFRLVSLQAVLTPSPHSSSVGSFILISTSKFSFVRGNKLSFDRAQVSHSAYELDLSCSIRAALSVWICGWMNTVKVCECPSRRLHAKPLMLLCWEQSLKDHTNPFTLIEIDDMLLMVCLQALLPTRLVKNRLNLLCPRHWL